MPRADPPLYPDCPAAALDAVRLGVPLRATSWTAWDALWAMLGWFLIGNGVTVLLLLAGFNIYGPAFLLTVVVPWIAMAGWPLWVTRRRGNGAEVDLGLRFRRSDVLAGLAGGAAAFVVGILASYLSVALFGQISARAADEAAKVASSAGDLAVVLFAILIVVGAPFAEELAFRGLLWSGLAKRGVASWVSILVSGLAFAAIHFEPRRLLVLGSIGIVLGVVRWRTGSLGACIIAHGVNNLAAALGLLALLGQG